MKRVFTFLSVFIMLSVCSYSLQAQDCQGYVITYKSEGVNRIEFLKVFSKFDYEKFRPKFVDYTMVFNNGIEIKLIAADKLKVQGCPLKERDNYPAAEFLQKNISYFQYNIKQGTIMAAYNSQDSK